MNRQKDVFVQVSISPTTDKQHSHSLYIRVSAAIAYAITSISIMMVNKYVLTSYGLPSPLILAISQAIVTIIAAAYMKVSKNASFPDLSVSSVITVFPLPLLFLINTVAGLSGSKSISIPMFSVLRRFTLLMTLTGEYFLLKKVASKSVLYTLFIMILGALIAASDDLAFDLAGYSWIFLNDFMTAANGVYMKFKMLNATEFGKWGLLYYNSIIALPILITLFFMDTETFEAAVNFPYWSDPSFLILFTLSSCLGVLLNLSVMYCTYVNSALTTAVVGCLKNVVTTYLGMIFTSDYVFSMLNFIGINVSLLGSLIYAYINFKE